MIASRGRCCDDNHGRVTDMMPPAEWLLEYGHHSRKSLVVRISCTVGGGCHNDENGSAYG